MSELAGMTVGELSEKIYRRLVLGGEPYDSRFSQEAHDIFIDAWKNGGDDFKKRLEEANRKVIAKVIQEGRYVPWGLVLMVEYFLDRQAWPLVMSLVKDCQHRDCLFREPEHMRYFSALASIQPEDGSLKTFWLDQISMVMQNRGSSICARLALSALRAIDFDLALQQLPRVARYIVESREGVYENWFVLFLSLISPRPDLLEEQAKAVWAGLPNIARNETSRRAFERVLEFGRQRATVSIL